MEHFKHIVFSGGGIKGISFIGCLHSLNEYQNLNLIESVTGCSIGSFIGLLFILGYTPKEMYDIMIEFDFTTLQEIEISKLFNQFGIDSGYNFVKLIKELIELKLGKDKSDITLLELNKITNKHLKIVTTCLNTRKSEYFDHITEPNLKVYDAIRMSISIPIFYTAPKYKNKIYTDGGILNNYPINLFDPNDPYVIGFNIKQKQLEHYDVETFESFILNSIYCVIQELDNYKTSNHKLQTVYLDSGISIIDFDISLENKKKLYRIGLESTKEYLNSKNNLSTPPPLSKLNCSKKQNNIEDYHQDN